MLNGHKTSVLLVDDHSLVAELVSKYLPLEGAFSVVVVNSQQESLEKIGSDGPFDVVLLDLLLPERLSLADVEAVVKCNTGGNVVVFSGNANKEFVQKCLDFGALGLIPKTLSLRSLASTINLVASGEAFVPAGYFPVVGTPAHENEFGLNANEFEILNKLGEGLANKEIMNLLDLPESTVKMRVRSLCRKLNSKNRTHAVITAREAGLL